jgi:alpha-glucoside transport system permease protein
MKLGGIASRAFLALACLVWITPTVGLLISSLRHPDAIRGSGWWTVLAAPAEWTRLSLDNYAAVVDEGMGRAFVNSLLVAVPATICPIVIAAFAAYALCWMRLPARPALLALFIGLLVVPVQATMIPLLQTFVSLGIAGTFSAVWIAHAGFGIPLAVYVLRNYIASLPPDLIESARLDGAGDVAIFRRVVVPLSVPALAAFSTFQFLWVWNDLIVALVFLGGSPKVQVLTVALQTLVGSHGEQWYLLTAGAFVTMVAPLLVFVFLQRHFVRGLTAGAIK